MEGTNRTLCTRIQDKGALTLQETDPGLSMSVQESPAEAWFSGGLLQGVGALSVAVHSWDLLKEVPIIFITSTIVWPQVNSREGTQPCLSTENWIKDLLSMAPPIRKVKVKLLSRVRLLRPHGL